MTKSPWAKDEVGNRYSRLVVLRRSVEKSKHRSALWDCLCDCGNETTVSGSSMQRLEVEAPDRKTACAQVFSRFPPCTIESVSAWPVRGEAKITLDALSLRISANPTYGASFGAIV